MHPKKYMDELDAAVQAKLDGDTEFHSSIADLSDDEKSAKVEDKRKELSNQLWKETIDAKKKAEQIAEDQRGRATKAEARLKEANPEAKQQNNDDLSSKDVLALMNAKVHQDDVEEVAKLAKSFGKSIPEALKDDTIKIVLERREELRKTANATNTQAARAGAKKITGDELIRELSQGNVPEKGSKESEDLFWARRGRAKK